MIEKKTILVTGANGQLGNEMQALSSRYAMYNFLFVTKEQLAIDDFEAVKNYFAIYTVDFCVNCAAYTAVDKAESEPEKAYLINAEAVGNLAMVCAASNTKFIHISTDYVFDGTATTPYLEDSAVSPVNLYGASKLKGEVLALQNNPRSIIIRTSWVYAAYGNNFVKTMLRLMNERESINVVSDQQGCPTYAADLAEAIMQIISRLHGVHSKLSHQEVVGEDTDHGSASVGVLTDRNKEQQSVIRRLQRPAAILNDSLPSSHIFNYSNAGVTNWYQFALAIKELSGSTCAVNPIPAAQYPTPAKRPGYSVMGTNKIQQTFNIKIPEWKDSLAACMKILVKK